MVSSTLAVSELTNTMEAREFAGAERLNLSINSALSIRSELSFPRSQNESYEASRLSANPGASARALAIDAVAAHGTHPGGLMVGHPGARCANRPWLESRVIRPKATPAAAQPSQEALHRYKHMIRNVCVYAYTCGHILNLCMYVFVCVCVYIYIYIYIYMHTYIILM